MSSYYDNRRPARGSLTSVASLSRLPRTRIVLSVTGMLMAMLLAALDQTIVATALPRVVADLGGFGQFAWVFTAYMLASTTSIPIMGKLSDVYGRKWVLLAGVLIFLTGSALCGISQDMFQLVMFRGIQGLGAGSIIANSYAVVGDVFPPAQRGKWIGVVGAVYALATVIGPFAGGYITDNLNWRWIFFLNLPLGVVCLAVIILGMANIRDLRVGSKLDFRGIITLIASVVPLLLALTWAGKEFPWSSPLIMGLFLFSGLMAVVFIFVERRATEPVIPGVLFTNPIFTVAVLVTFLTSIGMFGAILFIPLYVQGVIGSSATNAGFALMPMMLSGVVSAVVAGQVISRTGRYRVLAIGGVSVMALGALLFTRLDADSSNTEAIRNMVLAGAGLGVTVPAIMIASQNAFPHHMLGVVTASLQFFRNIGGAVGTAVLGSFMVTRLGDWLSGSSPPGTLDSLSPHIAEQLRDPTAIINPGAITRTLELAGQEEGGTAAVQIVVEGLRSDLAAAMHDVFLLGLGITLLAVVAMFFLKEIPLRSTMAESRPETSPGSPD